MPEKQKRIRRPKHTYDYIKAEFKKLGYTLLSKTYVSSKQPLTVRCRKGHFFKTCWNNFSRGTRCKKCFIDKCAEKSVKKIVLRDRYYNVSEAARILGVEDRDLRSHIQQGLLPGPKHAIGKVKKHYKMEDIKEIEKLIE